MQRTQIRMLEIALWVSGAYLVFCLLTFPPHKWFVRTLSYTATPPIIVSEVPRSDYQADPHPLRLVPFLSLRQWKEQTGPGGGPLTSYQQVIGKPDLSRTLLWALGITCITALLAYPCRALRRRPPLLSSLRGFEIAPTTAPPAPISHAPLKNQ